MTPHKWDKIRGPTQVKFCFKTVCFGGIVKKPIFQNFENSKSHSGQVCREKLLKICMDHFFMIIYASKLKNLKSELQHLCFSYTSISWIVCLMAISVCTQNDQNSIQKLILTCQMILQKGHGILRKKRDFLS